MRAEMAANGELPLDYMLRVMRDPHEAPSRRDFMAAKAAPYLHPQLAAVAHRVTGPNGGLLGPTVQNVFVEASAVPALPAPVTPRGDDERVH